MRKAIGALNKDIIQQFLIESIVVTIFGGIFAVGLSFVISYFVNQLQIEQVQMYINTTVVITAFTLTLMVGILSGILPAKRAANLKPIEALRFE
ncbi:MAG: FtsX-like permease family protein [Candidatus Peribacteria bacterium]|nr:FtsX-like permease family protein [Candidatus Peribacteria bacterium]